MRKYLNNGWQFFKEWKDDIVRTKEQGESVRLPHANVETPFNCFDESIYQFVSGYKLVFDCQGKKTRIITFDGVAHEATVFVNGKKLCCHKNGYTAFSVDVTGFVHDGDNELVVKVDSRENLNQPPFGYVIDYMTYGGIYRDVYMDEYDGTFVKDVFVVSEPNKPVFATVSCENVGDVQVVVSIKDGENVLWSTNVKAEKQFEIKADVNLENWDVNSPKLYTFEVVIGNETHCTTFGSRKAEFTKDGFFLNGKKVKIVGLDRHQSFPYVGYAMPESIQRRDAQILKNELCVNAVRTSHYPQSQYFVDECDKLGLLVFTEVPGWQHIGDVDWQMQTVENVKEMVLQYRNHPSVVLWGVRINESLDNNKLYTETNRVAHELDPTRQTGGVRYLQHSELLEDVYTYNDFNRNGATNRNSVCSKDVPYLVTEYNGHMFPTKTFDDAPHRREHVLRYARMLDGVFKSESTCGSFGWCMFDYNTHKDFGSGDRICYHGVTDMFRNKKDAGYVFSLNDKKPFVKLCFSSDIGDYPEGAVGKMYCLTNAEKIKVYKGNVFIKEYTHENSPFKYLPNAPIVIDDLIGNRLTDEDGISPRSAKLIKEALADVKKYGYNFLPLSTKIKVARIMLANKMKLERLVALYNKYEGGWGGESSQIVVEAYNGDLLVAKAVAGSANTVKLDVDVSSQTLHEGNSYDVSAVRVKAVDQNGNLLPYVNSVVNFETSGSIELIGPKAVALQGGCFGTYVKSVKKGKGTLKVNDQTINFTVE